MWRIPAILLVTALASLAAAQPFSDPFVGEYEGTYTRMGREAAPVVAQVVAVGDAYRLLAIAGTVQSGETLLELPATRSGATLNVSGSFMGVAWTGTSSGDTLTAGSAENDKYGDTLAATRVERTPPTLGAAPPEGAVVLLPYTPGTPTNLSAWNHQNWLILDDGSVQVSGGADMKTNRQFHDFRLHVEYFLPLVASASGQARGNSGVYLNERYEIQILDSFGVAARSGDCGALYRRLSPLVNACLPPERWQAYDIAFSAPRLGGGGELIRAGRVTVDLNGVRVQDEAELTAGTGSREALGNLEFGSILLQQHANPVRFRNIWLEELSETGVGADWRQAGMTNVAAVR
jgi:hypothetical protein